MLASPRLQAGVLLVHDTTGIPDPGPDPPPPPAHIVTRINVTVHRRFLMPIKPVQTGHEFLPWNFSHRQPLRAESESLLLPAFRILTTGC